jgi:hypothetical protein
MTLRPLALALCLVLAGCAGLEPERGPTILPPEVTVVSDFPPVKAATIPRLRELGYVIAQDSQFWTILTKPGGLSLENGGTLPPTRLTVTFASIRTHTRVIADTQFVMNAGTSAEQAVPAPNHPDRARILAILQGVKAEVERTPLAQRRGAPAPTANLPAQPGAARPGIVGRDAPSVAPSAPAPAAATSTPAQGGQTITAPQPAPLPTAPATPRPEEPLRPGQTRVRL